LPLLHIKLLHAIQPEGPYLLAGFCNGGLVANEMAGRLYAEGQTVELLVFTRFEGVFVSMPE